MEVDTYRLTYMNGYVCMNCIELTCVVFMNAYFYAHDRYVYAQVYMNNHIDMSMHTVDMSINRYTCIGT